MVKIGGAAERTAGFTTRSPEETRTLARRLAELCLGGEVLFLRGDLGAGKTCFAQGLAAGLGLPPETRVTSPTFIVHAEYPGGRLLLNHLDLYRLEEASQLSGFGIDEMIVDQEAVTVVEWPELLAEVLGDFPRLEIAITDEGDGLRNFRFHAIGTAEEELLVRFAPDPDETTL